MLASSQEVHHDVVHSLHNSSPRNRVLKVNDQQQDRLRPMPLHQQVQQLRNLVQLRCRRDGSDKEHSFRSRIDGVEALDTALVSLMHARVSGIVMPEGVEVVAIRCHLTSGHHLLGGEFKEAIEVCALVPAVLQKVHQALVACPHPVKWQGLCSPADVLEGELRPAEAAQGDQHDAFGLLVYSALAIWERVHEVGLLHARLPLGLAGHLHRHRHSAHAA
mmetsp:Transcript_114483/g.272372  ORF Transcript_114483/g.272372 Transcript_114483/m.272372 type:complete len:219 (+) Transcript_114483:587-1243(+)